MKLSVVSTIYYSAPYIEEFYHRITAAISKITDDYELIIVDDGSPDNSIEIIKSITNDARVRVLELSRNFGHHKAIMMGLKHAKGDLVFIIDSDLEEAPESLLQFHQKMLDTKCDVVYGVQTQRDDRLSGRIFAILYYYFIKKLTKINLPKNLVTTTLMSRNYLDALLSYQESEFDIGCLWHHVGFHQEPCDIKKVKKETTTYTFARKITIALNAITSFSIFPLTAIFILGLLILIFSISYGFFIIFQHLVNKNSIEGWTSLIISIWFFGGLILLTLGIIGLYLSVLIKEAKNRPLALIKKIHHCDTE